jgi:penicillin-binding protein 2
MGTPLALEKLAIVKEGMWAVLNEPGGTAYLSRVPGVEAGGKTGTVQVVGRESQPRPGADTRKLEDHAWFAGFAPMDDPKIVVVVFVENGGHGSAAAAPLGKLLLAYGAGKPIEPPPAPSPVQRASFSFDGRSPERVYR